MLTKLSIPKTIKVGFQNRADTYNGKLAYVVYTDSKNVVRKEQSWERWRDKKIDVADFDNVPTSGFVLNKKVGDHGGGWNSRKAWIRVYDPREFEFEISVANLLFILEETSAIKGKGLEGEFVYSWDGSNLVLLPVASQEYKSSSNFTELQTRKVTAKEMHLGWVYLNKNNEHVMYLGRHDWFEMKRDYVNNPSQVSLNSSKQHVFVSVDSKSTYWVQTGFTKLGNVVSTEPSLLFAEEYEKFKNSVHGSAPVDIVGTRHEFNEKTHYYRHNIFYKKDGHFFPIDISFAYGYGDVPGYHVSRGNSPVMLNNKKQLMLPSIERNNYYSNPPRKTTPLADIKAMELYALHFKNEKQTLVAIS